MQAQRGAINFYGKLSDDVMKHIGVIDKMIRHVQNEQCNVSRPEPPIA